MRDGESAAWAILATAAESLGPRSTRVNRLLSAVKTSSAFTRAAARVGPKAAGVSWHAAMRAIGMLAVTIAERAVRGTGE